MNDTPGQRRSSTDEAQWRASDPKASVWVSANAGSGKTHVLTNRIARLLLSGTPPERILCLTFTKAAAAEMSSRLYRRLGAWAVLEEDALRKEIETLDGVPPSSEMLQNARRLFARAIETPGGLKIQTIHAFCERLLGRFPLEAGVPPNFEILDERNASELLEEVRDYVIADANATPNNALGQALAHIVALIDQQSFSRILGEIVQTRGMIAHLKQHYGGLEGVIRATRAALGVKEGVTAEEFASELFDACPKEALRALLPALLEGSVTDQRRAEQLAAVLAAPAPDNTLRATYIRAFLTADQTPLKTLLTKGQQQRYPAALDVLLNEQSRVHAHVAHLKSIHVAEATAALLHLADAVLETYGRVKRARALLDYDDLILSARNLLTQNAMAPWVLYKLDGGIDHILVDEAQDTSPLQWEVVASLADEFTSGRGARELVRTVFVVGDEKQSIFSFQGADPKAFDAMHRHFARKVRDADQRWSPENLVLSFRSAPQILQAVDAVFAEGMPARRGLIMSDDLVQHAPNRREDAGLVELWEPETADTLDPPDPWDAPLDYLSQSAPAAKLARRIASRIAGWLADGEILPSRGRAIEPGDILVLVRRRNAFVDELVRALKEKRVPVAGRDRMILTEQIAVMDMLVLARFVLLPEDDLSLATLLKTPLLGLDEDDLFALAHGRKSASLWSELQSRKAEKESWQRACVLLEAMLARADFVPPYEFFAHVLDVEGGRAAALARLGEGAADALDEFLALALDYERDHAPSLQGFLVWIEKSGSEIKRDMEQGRNEVRVMTVHGAKGLEADIVFLPDTCNRPDGKNDPELLLHEEGELSQLLLWPVRRAMESSVSEAARQRHRIAQEAEYRRLLYVAMTRARDRLYIGGYLGRRATEPLADSWYAFMAQALKPLAQELTEDTGTKIWRLTGEQKRAPIRDEAKARKPSPAPGLWITTGALAEPAPSRPLAPSRLPPEGLPDMPVLSPLLLDPAQRFQRGRLIHRLLQTLPDLAPVRWRDATEHFLAAATPALSEGERREICDIVIALLEHVDFAPLFAAGSRAEVPLVGQIEYQGRPLLISAQIDRLCVNDQEVLIVDYKTNRPPPREIAKVPAAYVTQMAAYRALLQQIYPGTRVRAALLWTEGPFLMELPENLMEAALGQGALP